MAGRALPFFQRHKVTRSTPNAARKSASRAASNPLKISLKGAIMSAVIVEITTRLQPRTLAAVAVPTPGYHADNQAMKKDSPYPYSNTAPPGATIRALRLARDWSQRDLAERCDLDHTRISGIERGSGGYTSDALSRIAEALGVQVADLFLPRELAHFSQLPKGVRDKIAAYIAIETAVASNATEKAAVK